MSLAALGEGVRGKLAIGVIPTIMPYILAHLPFSVDLTKRNSGGNLGFTVKSGGQLLGTLVMGRGSVQWRAPKAKKATGEWSWIGFSRLLSAK